MGLRRRSLMGMVAWPLAGAAEPSTMRHDRIVLPPERREFRSRSGDFVLTLSTPDGWRSREARAHMQQRTPERMRTVWQRPLPQQHGARHVLVADSGAVVLVDEWINVPSRHAVMLLSPQGELLAEHGIDALVQLLRVPRRSVAAQARYGIWLSALPELPADGRTAVFHSAGRRLVLQLADGQLTVAD